MSRYHAFTESAARSRKYPVRVCRHCGTRRRRVFFFAPTGVERTFYLFALPGRVAWTDTNHRCSDVRAGKVNGR